MSSSTEFDYEAALKKTKFYDSKQYRYLECLGKGGNGACYLIAERQNIKLYALKISDSKETIDREIENFKKVNIPLCTKSIEHYSEGEEVYWNLMEYIPGISLDEFIENLDYGMFKTADFMKISTILCSQIAALHTIGVAHRDIKPANIIIDADIIPHIIDYGDCKNNLVLDKKGTTGYIHGTFPFMSKEAMQFETSLSSDVFSLGATLYNMITGFYPFYSLYNYIYLGNKKDINFYKKKTPMEGLFAKLEEIRDDYNAELSIIEEIEDNLENSEEINEEMLKEKEEAYDILTKIQNESVYCVDKIIQEIICSDQYDDIYQNYRDFADPLSDKQKELMNIVYLCFNPDSTQRPTAIEVRDLIFELAPPDVKAELSQIFEEYGFKDETIKKGEYPVYHGNDLESAKRAINLHFDYINKALTTIGEEYIHHYKPSGEKEFSKIMATYSASSYK